MEQSAVTISTMKRFPAHGWAGLGLIAIFWTLNWTLDGLRTHWGFFPLWLGFCLTVDGAVLYRTGTSLITRSWRKYVGLFFLSAPVWWIFEAINVRLQNWVYLGVESFDPLTYFILSTLAFSTVIPAVLGSAELAASFRYVKNMKSGPVIRLTNRSALVLFLAGWISLGLLLTFPIIFFPLTWISMYLIVEPVNFWLKHRSLERYTSRADWRPIVSLFTGVLITGFFWEMWNYFAYPKWIYEIPWANWFKIFEMPILGYGGYLPFALELFALTNLVYGLLGEKTSQYVRVTPQN